ALALPLGLRLFVSNAQAATGNFATAVDVSVYLKTDVPLAKAQQLAQAAQARRDVAAVTVIPADKGLEDFRAYSGFGDALKALTDNPLPNVLHVRPRAEASSAAALTALRGYFAAWPEVDSVQVDSEWVMRFNAILEVLRRLLAIAGAARDRRGGGDRQYHPPGDRRPPPGDRGHEAGGRLERLRAPAVSLHRRAVRPGRGAHRLGHRRRRDPGAAAAGGHAGAAVRQPLRAGRALGPGHRGTARRRGG